MKAAVQAELGNGGLTVLHGRDGTSDIDVRLEIRVSAGLLFLRGHVTLTAESDGTAVAMAVTRDEFHREGDFPSSWPAKRCKPCSTQPALAEFAEKKNPPPVAGRHEPRSASGDTKPSPEAVASAKQHFNQGNRHHELATIRRP